MKWKLENNTTRIGQNLKGVWGEGGRKERNYQMGVKWQRGKKRKKRRIKEVNLTAW